MGWCDARGTGGEYSAAAAVAEAAAGGAAGGSAAAGSDHAERRHPARPGHRARRQSACGGQQDQQISLERADAGRRFRPGRPGWTAHRGPVLHSEARQGALRHNPPSPIDVVADGQSVVVRDRNLATQDLYPLSQTPLRFLLADHIDLMRDTNVISVSSDDTFVTLVIEEHQLVAGTSRLMMMFGAKDMQLRQWTVTDPQGYDTTVAVYNLDTTKKPDPDLFVINYPDHHQQ